jgi:class 3 adenylate cyclase/tetratricopeptide (TPR) repeat protein
MDVVVWLRSLGLGKYEAAFRENEIDATVLPSLTHETLKELGVTAVGHRLKLLDAIAALRSDASDKTPSADAATAWSTPNPRPEDRAERRQVTVMFSDLVGSTALSARMDPEDLREVISTYQKCVAKTVHRFGGFVAKYMGDGVLIYFGYPQAHEDDAERAVRAGLELVGAVGALKTRAPLQTRVGIATGLVVVGDLIGSGASQERAIVGETPNLAARLQGVAEPNNLVIAESTRKLVGNLFELEDLGAQDLKGIAGPVRAWVALRPASFESRFDALHATGLTELVGREKELELLLRRWSKGKTREGQVVLLSGEPGIGKSRLTAALLERIASEPHTRLRYFCSPQRTDSALFPIISQMERAARFVHNDTVQVKLDKLDALLRQSSTTQQDAALLSEMLSLPNDGRYPALELAPQQRRQKTLEALHAQVETFARQSPVLMVFEDAHWSDPTSLEAFGRAVDRIATLPVLLLITFRPEFEPPWIGQPHVTSVTLNRLAQREVEGLIDSVAGSKPMPANIRQEIIERTDGIPLFVEEMTKAVLEAESQHAAERMAAGIPSWAVAVPATLHASLMARLDWLGSSAKEVAQIGAAIGREFSYGLLTAVVRKSDEELHSALNRLVETGLLFPHGVPPDATYVFKHALVQDAAYGTLLRELRRALHARIAATLESQFAEIEENHPELLARHYTEAGLIAQAAAPGVLVHHFEQANASQKAVFYFERAGDRAAAAFANPEAIAFFNGALAQAELLFELAAEQRDRWQASSTNLREKIGDVLSVTGQHKEARDTYQAALSRCAEGGRELRARLYRKIGQTWARQRQNHREALIAYAEAEAILGSEPAEDVRSWQQEWVQIQLERLTALYLETSTHEMERMIAQIGPLIGQQGSPAQRGQFYQAVVRAAYRRDRFAVSDQTLNAAEASVDAYREVGALNEQQCAAQFSLGFCHLWRSELDRAEVALRDALALAERIGDAADRVLCLTYLTVLYRKRGRTDEVSRFIARSRAACVDAQMPGYAAVADATLGRSCIRSSGSRFGH